MGLRNCEVLFWTGNSQERSGPLQPRGDGHPAVNVNSGTNLVWCAAQAKVCLPWSPLGLSRCRCAPWRPEPGTAPIPALPHSPPSQASRKLPVHSPAFFGRESCRFAPAPKGVYTKQSAINTGAAPCSPRRVARRSARASLAGEMSSSFLPLRGGTEGRARVAGRRGEDDG